MLKQIVLKFGSVPGAAPLAFDPLSMTVFVGPNNSGKSLILREIYGKLGFRKGGQDPPEKIIDSLGVRFPASGLAQSLVDSVSTLHPTEKPPDGSYWAAKGNSYSNVIKSVMIANLLRGRQAQENGSPVPLEINDNVLTQLLSQLTLELDGKTRLTLTEEQPLGDLLLPTKFHLAKLFRDPVALSRVKDLIRQAFGDYFVLDPTNLGKVRVRMALRPPADTTEEQALDQRARDYHSAAKPISEFSDGVKAYIGVVSMLASSEYRLILLDEPEAFLHPPLARKLGTVIAKLASERDATVFAATHSVHFVMGCIASGTKMNIVRLTFQSGVATARLLPYEKLLPLMRDPVMRSAGALGALFATSAVVCEADGDRAFYEEINTRLTEAGMPAVEDALFLNVNGKNAVHKIVKPLRELGVPAAVIVDLDILDEGLKVVLDACYVPSATVAGMTATNGNLMALYKGLNKKVLKEDGFFKLKPSDQQAGFDLLEQLCKYGIFVVPIGELEQWLKPLQIPGKKDDWLSAMYVRLGSDPDSKNYVKPSSGDVWDFVAGIQTWVSNPNRLGMPSN